MTGRRGQINAELDRGKQEPILQYAARMRTQHWRLISSLVLLVLSTAVLSTMFPVLLAPFLSDLQPLTSVDNNQSWVGVMHDAGNANASAATLRPPLREAWSVATNEALNDASAVVSVVGDRLLVSTAERMILYNASDGKELKSIRLKWSMADDGRKLSTLSLDGNFIYYVSDHTDYKTVADNVDNQGCTFCRPYYPAPSYYITALNTSTGKIVWEHQLGGSFVFVQDPNRPYLIVSDNYEVISLSGHVRAINRLTGELVWQTGEWNPLNMRAKLAVSGDSVFVYFADGELSSLDASQGQLRWKLEVENAHRLLADKDHVYLTFNHGVKAYNRNGGYDPTFSYVDKVQTDKYVESAIVDGTFYVAATTDLENIASRLVSVKYGRTNWDSSFMVVPSTMVASEEYIYMVAYSYNHSYLLAFKRSNGEPVWQSAELSSHGGIIRSRPIIANNMLYVIYDGFLHAYAGVQ